jgi:hypothetical protein
MLERLGLAPVKFTDDDIFSLYDAPREGAELMVKLHAPDKTVEPRVWALDRLKYVLGNWKAPPGDDRLIGVQEIETILCKWKSHKAGKYTVGKDIAEVGHALQFGGNTPLLRLMRGTFKTHLEATS